MGDSSVDTGCDILIAGGGPAGAALALALADGARRITVVEARAQPPQGDTRATALGAGSVRLLTALGVWAELAPGAVPVHTVEVSQAGQFGRARLRASELGTDYLGQVVAYDALARVLAGAARAAPGVEWLAPASVEDIRSEDAAVRLQVLAPDGVCERTAALAVAAEGTHSPLRAAAGIGTRTHDYEQTALLTPVETRGDPHTGYERFTADGPMALLPAGGASRTLVWTLPPERARAHQSLDRSAFAQAVGRCLGRSLGPVVARGTPAAWPLKRVEAQQSWRGRVALIGNAARTLHPVGAQGFNLALRDVGWLAASLATAADPGDPEVLEAWARARRLDRACTRGFTDILARGFVRGGRALAGVRAGALIGLDSCPAAKSTLAGQTMGLIAGLPRIGRWQLEGRS